ncbi:G-type lectin S-receptor-like serine/threonine-protein kinase SD3-1 [Malania oleifera]|uniref:G-type lectin S-receptor-like serine/threonine-protein kinase SD3-1 n=1 Tax=Malania oleifera TaxID=397392 RepID=UPI0025AE0FF0|nr:G-type lectin S-receptor-like serine/threonine-protein kinase SD3-1 [Malania oleifera]
MLGKEIFLLVSSLVLCIFIGFLLFPVVLSEIPLGSKFSVVEMNVWVSSNGYFALGFFNRSDQPSQFSVGIHFNSDSIPASNRKVVWVAGADVSVGGNSYFQLMQSGELVLFDSLKGVFVWGSKTSHLSVSSAVLGDNGNLVLMNKNKEVVWQSFDTPSDTLLPGQNLSIRQTLRAASRNSVSSYYSLCLDVLGQLQLRWESDVIYWTNGSPSHSNLSLVLASEGALQLLDQRYKVVWSVYGEDHNDSVSFRFLRLDVDGNLRLYSWVEASRSWRSVWQAVENQCDVFATCDLCGICVFNGSGSAVCKCTFSATAESSPKCLVPYQQSCESDFTMFAYEHTFLYGIYPPNDTIITTSLQQCRSSCLNDPLCTAVTYTNDGTARCRMKKTQYITGHSNPSLRSISFVKMCSDPVAVLPRSPIFSAHSSPVKQPYGLCMRCQIGAASAAFVAFFIIQFGIGFYIYKKRKYIRKKAAVAYIGSNSKGLIMLSYNEIMDLTGNFKHQVGPQMFKGILPNDQQVVIKNIEADIEERKFRSAVLKLGSIHHKNLLRLEGYCCEPGHRYLVYEFAKNDSLDKHLKDSKLSQSLNWRKRIDICLSIARAICYLHTGCREFFSHGNLKCENVVLDKSFEAKVTEFGLGRVREDASHKGSAAEKDVHDFGKMVLMLVSARLEAEDVSRWAYEEWVGGQAKRVVDERIEGEVDLVELERTLRIAFWCLQVDGRMRPPMGEVVMVLEGTLSVDPPPPPFVCRRPSVEEDSSE